LSVAPRCRIDAAAKELEALLESCKGCQKSDRAGEKASIFLRKDVHHG